MERIPASQFAGGGSPGGRDDLQGGEYLLPLEELRLVRAYQEGEEEALVRLLTSYQRRVYSICRRMVREEEAARDLTQDVLIKIMQGVAGFDARAKLSTWVYRITINCCLSYIRREGVRKHQSWSDAPVAAAAEEGCKLRGNRELSGEMSVLRDELLNNLRNCLDEIDPEHRSVLILRDIQGLEYQQVGEVLKIPLGTVKSRLYRARAALREAMRERMDGEGDRSRKSIDE